jgi:hypothetical protein
MTTYFGCIMSNKADHFYIDGIDDLSDVDRLIRPLCDQAHRMFVLEGSPSFNDESLDLLGYA